VAINVGLPISKAGKIFTSIARLLWEALRLIILLWFCENYGKTSYIIQRQSTYNFTSKKVKILLLYIYIYIYILFLRKHSQLVSKEETMDAGKQSSSNHASKVELSQTAGVQKSSVKQNILELNSRYALTLNS
jgi:hypothetical protein